MGGGGGKGGSKAPKMPEVVAAPQPVQMPEVPAVAPAPEIAAVPETPDLLADDTTVQTEMARLEEEEAKRRRLMAGRQSTILTDPLETWNEEEKPASTRKDLLESDDQSGVKVSTLKKTDTLGG